LSTRITFDLIDVEA